MDVPVQLHPPASIADALGHWVRHMPEAPAMVCNGEPISYSSLLERARGVAAGFSSVGVGAGSVICLQLPPSPAFVMGLVGIEQLGAVAAPLPTQLIPYGLERYLRMIRPAAICCPEPTESLDCCEPLEELVASAVPIHHRIVDGTPPNPLWNHFESLERHGAFALERGLVFLHTPEAEAPFVLRPPLAPELQDHVFALSVSRIAQEGHAMAEMLSLKAGDRVQCLLEPSEPVGLSALVASLLAGAVLQIGDDVAGAQAIIAATHQVRRLLSCEAAPQECLHTLLVSDGSLDEGELSRVRARWPRCNVI